MNITEWTHPGTGQVRRYINDWDKEAGFEVGYYNTGNVKWATLDGVGISNNQYKKTTAKIWLDEDDNLHIDGLSSRAALTEEELRERLTKALEAHFAAEAAEREQVEREEAEAKAAEDALPTEGEDYVHSSHRVLNAVLDKVKAAIEAGELPGADLRMDPFTGQMTVVLSYRGHDLTLSARDKSPRVEYSVERRAGMRKVPGGVELYSDYSLLARGAFELDTTRLNRTYVNMIANFMIKADWGNPCRKIEAKDGEVMEYVPASKIAKDLTDECDEVTVEDVPEVDAGDCHERVVVRFAHGYLGGAVLTIDTFKPKGSQGGTRFIYKLTAQDNKSIYAWRKGTIYTPGTYDAVFIGENVACDLDRWDAMADDYSRRTKGTWLRVPAAHKVALTSRK